MKMLPQVNPLPSAQAGAGTDTSAPPQIPAPPASIAFGEVLAQLSAGWKDSQTRGFKEAQEQVAAAEASTADGETETEAKGSEIVEAADLEASAAPDPAIKMPQKDGADTYARHQNDPHSGGTERHNVEQVIQKTDLGEPPVEPSADHAPVWGGGLAGTRPAPAQLADPPAQTRVPPPNTPIHSGQMAHLPSGSPPLVSDPSPTDPDSARLDAGPALADARPMRADAGLGPNDTALTRTDAGSILGSPASRDPGLAVQQEPVVAAPAHSLRAELRDRTAPPEAAEAPSRLKYPSEPANAPAHKAQASVHQSVLPDPADPRALNAQHTAAVLDKLQPARFADPELLATAPVLGSDDGARSNLIHVQSTAAADTRSALSPNIQAISSAIVSLRDSGGQIDVSLTPEELGRLTIKLDQSGGTPTLLLTAERPETQELIRRHIEALQDQLNQMGFSDMAFSFERREDQAAGGGPDHEGLDAAPSTADPANLPVNRLSVETGLNIRI